MRRQKGFTLIELLIVVAIIGIIAAIAIPNLLNAIHRGRQKRTMSDMRTVGTAIGGLAGALGTAFQMRYERAADSPELTTVLPHLRDEDSPTPVSDLTEQVRADLEPDEIDGLYPDEKEDR